MALRVNARVGELITCLALVVFGVLVVWQASGMRMGSMALPGPGVLPLAFGVILCLGALISFIRAWRTSDQSVVHLGNRSIFFTICALAGFAAVFEPLGVKLSVALFIYAMATILSGVPWWKGILAGVIASTAVWTIFEWLLGVRLPAGML